MDRSAEFDVSGPGLFEGFEPGFYVRCVVAIAMQSPWWEASGGVIGGLTECIQKTLLFGQYLLVENRTPRSGWYISIGCIR